MRVLYAWRKAWNLWPLLGDYRALRELHLEQAVCEGHSTVMGHDRAAVSQRWRELISEQEASGQSIAAYCREHDVRAWQFYEWKKRLRQSAGGEFVAVSVKAEEASAALPEPVLRCSAIELRHSRGWSLKVEPGFDAVHLRRLLSVLESGS